MRLLLVEDDRMIGRALRRGLGEALGDTPTVGMQVSVVFVSV